MKTKRILTLISLLFLLFLNSCGNKNLNPIKTKHLNRQYIKRIKHWGYQLQSYHKRSSLVQIYNSKNKLWVIDYSQNGSQKNKFNNKQINILKKNNNLIISYLSIGEAENYRFYFKKMNKKILLKKNTEFTNNIKVKYWQKQWQDIFIGKSPNYLDYILEQGFDGIYLDIVDAFLSFPKNQWQKRAQQMLSFIKKISKYARKKNHDFIIIQQNAPDLFKYLSKPNELLNIIDAIALESVFYRGTKWENNQLDPDQYIISLFKEYQKHSIPIFSVEYMNNLNNKNINQYFELAKKYQINPLVTTRNLDGKLMISP